MDVTPLWQHVFMVTSTARRVREGLAELIRLVNDPTTATSVGIPPNRGDIVYEETLCHTHDASSTRSSGPVLCGSSLETRRPVVEIAGDLGIGAGTLGNWVRKDRIERGGAEGLSSDDRAEMVRLRRRGAELEMERGVLKRSVVLQVLEATR